MSVREDYLARRAATMASGRVDWSGVTDFGQVADTTIARRLGISQATVWNERTRRGIPAFVPPRDVAPTARPSLGGVGERPFNGAVITSMRYVATSDLTREVRERGILAALADLDDAARERVLSYAVSKWPVQS